jgi:hypothetical protein
MSQSLILSDRSAACWEKKKEEKRRNGQGAFFPGQDMPCWLCHMGFSWLLGAIKG